IFDLRSYVGVRCIEVIVLLNVSVYLGSFGFEPRYSSRQNSSFGVKRLQRCKATIISPTVKRLYVPVKLFRLSEVRILVAIYGFSQLIELPPKLFRLLLKYCVLAVVLIVEGHYNRSIIKIATVV